MASAEAELDVKHLGTNSSVQSPTRQRTPTFEVRQLGSNDSNLSPWSSTLPGARQKESCNVKHRSTGSSNLSPVSRLKTTASMVAPTRVEASLLRAVTSSQLLQRCAVSFQSQEFVDRNYQKSFETERIGDFISHDWASSRLGKLLALCLVYNSLAALVLSTSTAVVLAWLQYGRDPILPSVLPFTSFNSTSESSDERGARASKYGYWCMIVSPLVFVVTFLFWQDVRYVLKMGTRTCFLDKYCIDQANPERKAAGILGLAGFLRCSDRIIILWTPRYFTRLWCTYEVASWLHLQKPLTSVLFMPLAHANIVVTLAVAGWFSFLLLVVTAPYFPAFYLQLVGFGLLIGLSMGAHQARHSAAHLRAIQDQLSSFSVTSSNCFCCTVGHVQNGEEIPCDREVVYTTIAEWFNDARDDAWVSEEAALDRFDRAVRMHFAAQVLQKAGPTQLSYRYVVIAGWPYLFRVCDVMAAGADLPASFVKNALIMYCTITLAATPVWYKFAMHLACRVDIRVGVPRSRILDYTLSVVLGFTYVVAALLIWFPLELLASSSNSVLPMIAVALTFMGLNVAVYHGDLRECFCKRRFGRRDKGSLTDATLPAQIVDAIPFDMMDEGIPVPPPVLHKLRAVRISGDDESGSEEEDASSTRSI